jgi:hypothetical protein
MCLSPLSSFQKNLVAFDVFLASLLLMMRVYVFFCLVWNCCFSNYPVAGEAGFVLFCLLLLCTVLLFISQMV